MENLLNTEVKLGTRNYLVTGVQKILHGKYFTNTEIVAKLRLANRKEHSAYLYKSGYISYIASGFGLPPVGYTEKDYN